MKDRHLWLRISAEALPEGFSQKVASEFNWDAKQATEAIEEYRRFAYLSQVSDQQLSPPREVDLVWHMHLLYTRHYTGPWQNALKKPLHHEPAPVGTKESAFRKQYGQTRALYLEEFGSFATEKIWPTVEVLRRREVASTTALISFVSGVILGLLAGFMQNAVFGVMAACAFVVFFVSIYFAASANGGRSSFGVSSGNGDSGCGD